jgi:ABC-type amino acid transport substrate-binding protein
LERIKKNGKIVIGTAATTRPTHYTNEKGELIGYDIDWGHEIAESLGVEVEFVAGSFAGLIPGLIAEKFDIVVSALVITDERKEMIDFSDRYMADGAIAVVREDNDTVTDVKKLDGLKVGVLAGSGFLEDVKKLGGYAELKEYPGYPEAFIDLKAGRVDVYVSGKTGANDFIKHDDTAVPLKMVGEIYNMHESGVGFRKNEEELVEAINKIIAEKKQDGTYDELAMKWFGYNMPK